MFLDKAVFVLSIMQAAHGESRTRVFTRSQGVRFPAVYSTSAARSVIDCCRQCQEDGDCRAVNFRSGGSDCQFVKDVDGVSPVTDPGWTLLRMQNQENQVNQVQCAPGWIHFGDACYFPQEDMKMWLEAQESCTNLHTGAMLTDVSSDTEQAFLELFIQQKFAQATLAAVWIAGYNDGTGTFVWLTSGQHMESGYNFFQINQPGDSGEDCVLIEIQDGFRWHDSNCNVPFQSICKYRLQ